MTSSFTGSMDVVSMDMLAKEESPSSKSVITNYKSTFAGHFCIIGSLIQKLTPLKVRRLVHWQIILLAYIRNILVI